ncbi:hypothetical protein [Paenibacillus agilis]|uniref:CBM-cenC domain-containing protein n=1 Tax=Paenibacillus agilis TaxID=3020863 RepID=A0A559IX26_9BACL|nr:hypothetical protein [Paenibacillus agilis]TVX92187.1 hypothetical protein FPZ44_03415 [Paenibacillus agilis]
MFSNKSIQRCRIFVVSLAILFSFTISSSAGAMDSGVTYSYSSDGQLLFSKFSDGTYLDYFYDDNGNLVKKVSRYRETFERGNFETTDYMSSNPGYSGEVTNTPDKLVTGAYSVYGASDATWEWNTFLASDLRKLQLEPNTSYTVSFKYKVIKSPSEKGSHYFFSRSSTGNTAQDKGWMTWNDKAGSKGSKIVTFTTGPYGDYQLNWGTKYGGAISIDDIQVTKQSESFERGKFESTHYISGNPGYSGVVTNEAEKVVTGAYSVYGESKATWEWNSFLASNPRKLQLEPNTSYTVSFKYKVIKSPSEKGKHYFFSRTSTGNTAQDKGWTEWNDQAGSVGSKVVTFITGPYGDYQLNWGTSYGGAISIDDIQVTKLSESFEKGRFSTTDYMSGNPGYSGKVTKAPEKIVTGAYSVYGESDVTWEWNAFLTTDPRKVQLEPNTSYSVSFKYKVIKSPSEKGSHYFFSRTSTGSTAQDKGWTEWKDKVGSVGSKVVTFTTGPSVDYQLYWGTNYGGAISIDDIQVTKMTK